jgi:hypothetical protein
MIWIKGSVGGRTNATCGTPLPGKALGTEEMHNAESNSTQSPKLEIPVPHAGHQDCGMSKEEKLDVPLEYSMNASDPSEIVQPHGKRDGA